MTSRKNSDEHYVIDLCDEVLGINASRQHTFDFLRGDGNPGRKLPIDAYYPKLKLVVEYRERQHTESVAFFNKKTTISGVSRDEQRRIYDQRRKDVLPKHGIHLVEISYTDFMYDSRKRLIRNRQEDMDTIQRILSFTQKGSQEVEPENTEKQIEEGERKHLVSKKPVKDGRQTWVYSAYKKLGCLFILAVVFCTLFLSSYLCIRVFNLSDGATYIIVPISVFVVSFIFHHYTTGVDEKLSKERAERNAMSSIRSNTDHYPVCCPQCGSLNIGPSDDGGFVCIDCGLQWYQTY